MRSAQNASNYHVTQTIKKFVTGWTYTLSIYVVGAVPLVTIDGAPISLTAGTPIKKGTTIWTPETGTFAAQADTAVLTIRNPQPGSQIVFIDKVSAPRLAHLSEHPELSLWTADKSVRIYVLQ